VVTTHATIEGPMTVPGPERRREALRPSLEATAADVLLVTESKNVRYLTGFTGTNGQLLLTTDPARDRLLTDERYTARAGREAPGLEVVVTRDPVEAGLDAVTDAGGERLAVEADAVTWAVAERWRTRAAEVGVELVATTGLVGTSRLVKDATEIAALDEACRITVVALEELFADRVRVGGSERELATWLERRFVDLGADGVAFPSIVASGPNAAVPHHEPGTRTLAAGDVLTVDCGALVAGYHADVTRTVALGHLDDRLTDVHGLVERAQAAGRAAAVAGATTGDVDAATRAPIEAAGFGEAFVHGTGHGVGLDIHEEPFVSPDGDTILRPGMAITVEPGVYLDGVGGVRIEDTVVVTADGEPRVLTESPRELRLL
jgi:Xaa-Pro aminopeptidase